MTKSKHDNNSTDCEPRTLLFSLEMNADPKIKAVPQTLQNFATRTVIGRFWSSLLHVAEDVRDGKRPQHRDAIEQKQELYQWIDQRITEMIRNVEGRS